MPLLLLSWEMWIVFLWSIFCLATFYYFLCFPRKKQLNTFVAFSVHFSVHCIFFWDSVTSSTIYIHLKNLMNSVTIFFSNNSGFFPFWCLLTDIFIYLYWIAHVKFITVCMYKHSYALRGKLVFTLHLSTMNFAWCFVYVLYYETIFYIFQQILLFHIILYSQQTPSPYSLLSLTMQ